MKKAKKTPAMKQHRMTKTKIIKWSLVVTAVLALAFTYRLFDPAHSSYYPKCPFKVITGYHCPLCGSQQAIHHLLHWEWSHAIGANLLLVLTLPYILAAIIVDALPPHHKQAQRWRKWLFGKPTLWIMAGVVILFWIVRNIY